MSEPLICPACGARMNHHADKLLHEAPGDGLFDPDLDGVIEESHQCPSCGTSATRIAPHLQS
jgi:ribosomal protein S27AE